MSKPNQRHCRPGTVVGGYRLSKLAAGGFGVVYLAEDPSGGGRHLGVPARVAGALRGSVAADPFPE